MISKRDFITLADALREERPGKNWDANKHVQWELDVRAVARACKGLNWRFKLERWMAYVRGECGPNGGNLR